jgi:cellulose synthase/poly-beta-1,6-N-acetylglucosamine synthase-like glycosyltransferase
MHTQANLYFFLIFLIKAGSIPLFYHAPFSYLCQKIFYLFHGSYIKIFFTKFIVIYLMTSFVFACGIGSVFINNKYKAEECSAFQKKCSEKDTESGEKTLDDKADPIDDMDDFITHDSFILSGFLHQKKTYASFTLSQINGKHSAPWIPPPNC